MMLLKSEKKFSILFFLIVVFEIITAQIKLLGPLHYVAKMAIVSSLIIFFKLNKGSLDSKISKLTLIALFFSLFGDIALLFTEVSVHYFTIGLGCFLIAHLFYIAVFLKHKNLKNRLWLLFSGILLIYGIFLINLFESRLGDLKIPVIVYMLTIIIMATTAFTRKGKATTLSFRYVMVGALLFLISDSLLAINKFYQPFAAAQFLIMFTYAWAQYSITLGILKLKM